MACPTVEIKGRKVFLVSGYRTARSSKGDAGSADLSKPHTQCCRCYTSIKIEALPELQRSAIENPDAVAFGYVMDSWVPAA